MQIFLLTAILACKFFVCSGNLPEQPKEGVIPFMVYFESRIRGFCHGFLVSRMMVLTASVCVAEIHNEYLNDRRPINVIVGTPYRHPMRGIKVPVKTVLLPKLPNDTGTRGYLLQKSVALLILQKKIPDILTEEPLRAIAVDYKGEDKLIQQDECIMIGWNFFYREGQNQDLKKSVMQRNMRFQQLNMVNKEMYCDTLVLKYEKAIDTLGHEGAFVKNDVFCLRDPTYNAQPCHGMYGSPVICGSGRVVGMMMAPDAQWLDCTGYSVLVHELSNKRNRDFLRCLHPFFEPEMQLDWSKLKEGNRDVYDDEEAIKDIYDGVITDFSSSSDEVATDMKGWVWSENKRSKGKSRKQ